MPVLKGALVTAMLVLGATFLRAAPIQADPHELYTRASNELSQGDLKAAEAALAQLRAVIRSSPSWDPEGVFSRELMPPLQARLKRLRSVADKLDAFSTMAVRQLRPPDPLKVTSTVRNYTDWATSVVQRLRAERDRIIAADLKNPEERAILARTESYARTQQLLEVGALRQMADSTGDDILGLLAGDPNQESIMLRFRQLKLELMQAVADRDRLSEELNRYKSEAGAQAAGAQIAGPGPAGDSTPVPFSLRRPGLVWIAGALAAASGLFAWAMNARRRRIVPRQSLDDTIPGLVPGTRPPDADRDAA